MISRNAWLSILFTWFMVWTCAVARASDMPAEQLIAEVVASHRRLREAFRPTRVVYSLSEQSAPDADRTHSTAELLYSGENILMQESTGQSSEIQCKNPEYQFVIGRSAPNASWTIDRIQKTTSSNADSMIVLVLQEDPLSGVLFANHISIDDLLTNASTRVVSLEETTPEDDFSQRSLVMSLSLNPEAKTKETEFSFNFCKGTLTFVPDIADWIPTRVEMEDPHGNHLTFVNENFVTHGAFKVPTHCTLIARRPEGDEWIYSERKTEYSFDEIPSETFQLTHYGLPEPTLELEPNRYRLWFLGGGVIILALSMVVLLFRSGKQSV